VAVRNVTTSSTEPLTMPSTQRTATPRVSARAIRQCAAPAWSRRESRIEARPRLLLALSTLLSVGFVPLLFLGVSRAEHLLGALCWAVGMGAQDSIFKAAIAKLVDKARRARAYGAFFALFGLAWWLGSTFMGWLYGRSLTGLVAFSMGTQLLAVPLFLVIGRKLKRASA